MFPGIQFDCLGSYDADRFLFDCIVEPRGELGLVILAWLGFPHMVCYYYEEGSIGSMDMVAGE